MPWVGAPGQLNVTVMVADAPAHNTPQSGAKYHNFNKSNAFAKHVDVWTNPKKNTEQKLWMRTGAGPHDWRLVSFAEYPDPCDELHKLMAHKGSSFFFFSIKCAVVLRSAPPPPARHLFKRVL